MSTVDIAVDDPAIHYAGRLDRLLDDAQAKGVDIRKLRALVRSPFSRRGEVFACVLAMADLKGRTPRQDVQLALMRQIAHLSQPMEVGLFVAELERIRGLVYALDDAA